MTLFRVFPYLAKSRPDEPGAALYIPPQGSGRLDNPALYSVLYLSDHAAGAVAEAFGRFPEWSQSLLEGSPSLPGSIRALARYRLSDKVAICNLDDPRQLAELSLRPSDVVSRNYEKSREWARHIHDSRQWSGIRWWSYYNPAWSSFGLWDAEKLTLESIDPLRLDHTAFVEAGKTIVRRILIPR